MGWIKGIDVILHVHASNGTDLFGAPIKTDTQVTVSNVLVNPVSTQDILDTFSLTGKTIVYELCIPKGDTHVWNDTEVEFMGKKYITVGIPKQYIDSMVPLDWNKKVQVAFYE